uniref:Uncharacterized protein n=1 Tax=Cacopsylla melanoneura TaxID=428564 RepID=A0A8D8Y2H6_9HEMI
MVNRLQTLRKMVNQLQILKTMANLRQILKMVKHIQVFSLMQVKVCQTTVLTKKQIPSYHLPIVKLKVVNHQQLRRNLATEKPQTKETKSTVQRLRKLKTKQTIKNKLEQKTTTET